MKFTKLILLLTIVAMLTACKFTTNRTGLPNKSRRTYSVTVNFGHEVKTYHNVVSVKVPERFGTYTILHFDNDTSLHIIGGTVYWTDHIPKYH